ncbi:MAG: hypothetical protein AUG16_02385 [Thaumarchaeota archaeon 13_1_20CM_2_39_20]|nr:MAG: hypothetical protein AUI92_00025 [Thaumarchaeota archaeon 13_1_40CM_3_38_6]OLD22544.1 MAG: hypothetical protein AUI59_01435 [Thaumarchaeota archaeon 13_1_40CM_2_39_13_1]OLE40821.1 MAG: hypothetical protein AUG16_02385 [Thaumarchaeota archaeon 13_1_20CM_2_39_20]
MRVDFGKNTDDEKVRHYFDKIAEEFDDIYENKGSLPIRITNKLFRKDMLERGPIAIQESRPLKGKSVLDIGCGSGRVSFLFAKECMKVVGIDYARNMIELAKKSQQKLNLVYNVEFIHSDFMNDFPEDKRYDISIALGVFHYIKDPIPYLRKIKKITTTKIIADYPAKFAFQTPLRKIWLSKRNCPVFFYTKGELKKIYSDIGIEKIKIIPVPQGTLLRVGWIVISEVD